MAADRFQVTAQMDSLLPEDAIVNTLYFEDIGTSDADGLCADLAQIFDTRVYTRGDTQITVKSYDVGAPPNFPKGEAVLNEGMVVDSATPREVALCLSFYSERNLPRQRGRIYIAIAGAVTSVGKRPAQGDLDRLKALAQDLANLGGADVSWNVHSQTTGQDHEVTHAWVDDEWDTMRSRGLKRTDRQTVATGS